MSSRIFQSIIIQMKDATDRCMGVVAGGRSERPGGLRRLC